MLRADARACIQETIEVADELRSKGVLVNPREVGKSLGISYYAAFMRMQKAGIKWERGHRHHETKGIDLSRTEPDYRKVLARAKESLSDAIKDIDDALSDRVSSHGTCLSCGRPLYAKPGARKLCRHCLGRGGEFS